MCVCGRALGGRIKDILSVVWVRADGSLGRMVAEEVERGSDSGYILKVEAVDLSADWL